MLLYARSYSQIGSTVSYLESTYKFKLLNLITNIFPEEMRQQEEEEIKQIFKEIQ